MFVGKENEDLKRLFHKKQLNEERLTRVLLPDDELLPLVKDSELSDFQKQIIDFFMEANRKKGKSMEDMLSLVHTMQEEQYIIKNWNRAHV